MWHMYVFSTYCHINRLGYCDISCVDVILVCWHAYYEDNV